MIRVLLVDDEPAFARTARRILGAARGPLRLSLDDCRTAEAALTRLAERHYGAALIDWVLPDMSGIDALDRAVIRPRRGLVRAETTRARRSAPTWLEPAPLAA